MSRKVKIKTRDSRKSWQKAFVRDTGSGAHTEFTDLQRRFIITYFMQQLCVKCEISR